MSALSHAAAPKATRGSSICTRPRRRIALVAAAAAPGSDAAPPLSRRQLQAAALAVALLAVQPPAAQAVGFKKEMKKKNIPEEDYAELPAEPRLRFYELAKGNGEEAKEGSRVLVHFECKYRGLSVVSTRSARVLSGNRTVAEPFEYIAGQPVSGKDSARLVESAGGLFAGGGGPKPPAALSAAVIGMREGGKRSVLVPAELGYGAQGEQEIPPNCPSFELRVELLNIV